ncbi:hypothetical protein WR25_00138 [Diploscapter pachys]|uniref:Uncharacterized protein n=1 Tax=Diploscapter pachys TaxID=2018661 RepID=A0A2A2JLC4_9BILA|nr:hypothetical protein WR25_00138 [Diploscapter pachys]
MDGEFDDKRLLQDDIGEDLFLHDKSIEVPWTQALHAPTHSAAQNSDRRICTVLLIPSVMSTLDRKQAAHMLAPFGSIAIPHSQHATRAAEGSIFMGCMSLKTNKF